MEMNLELVPVPVVDIDRAKAFWVDQLGFCRRPRCSARRIGTGRRLTAPGSACCVRPRSRSAADPTPKTFVGSRRSAPHGTHRTTRPNDIASARPSSADRRFGVPLCRRWESFTFGSVARDGTRFEAAETFEPDGFCLASRPGGKRCLTP
jgi:hypothetical protein